MKDAFIGFRLDEKLKARLKTLADKEDRTMSQMATILLEEALNQRECSSAIRQADNPEIDMRFCSPHCRHLCTGSCFSSAVVDASGNADWFCLKRTIDTDKPIRDEHCPYILEDFQRWQRGADEDAQITRRLREASGR